MGFAQKKGLNPKDVCGPSAGSRGPLRSFYGGFESLIAC